MKKTSKIYIAGHSGLVGSSLLRYLTNNGYNNILYKTRANLDLMNQDAVFKFFENERPEYIFIAAARVGGIHDNNTYPVEFIRNNISIQWNLIEASFKVNVKRLIFFGSSCIYPVDCPRPIKEDYFCTGALEPTNQAYAVAKISGIEHCWSYNRQYKTQFLTIMPTNLYGTGDNYDMEKSHVLAGIIRKIHEAKFKQKSSVVLWGTGSPRREFLHVDDLASASCFLMALPNKQVEQYITTINRPPIINIGSGYEISIFELAKLVAKIIGFRGDIIWDHSKPDGVESKLMDISLIQQLGWEHKIKLKQGIIKAYKSFLEDLPQLV